MLLKRVLILLLLPATCALAQDLTFAQADMPLKFIHKVEVFAGPSLCFNHGNMFIENYRGEFANGNFVQNKRLTKGGYSFGIGAYHPVNDRIEINARLLWEQKGSKAELNHPVNPVNNDDREYITSEYTYNYLTLPVVLKIYINKKRTFALSLGGYVSKIKNIKGEEDYFYPTENKNYRSPISTDFIGRTLVGFSSDGGINTASFIPGLQGFEDYDYGAVIGVSYELKIKDRSSLLFQLVDNYGFANISKPNFTALPSPYERNHTVSIMIGYVYHRKSKL